MRKSLRTLIALCVVGLSSTALAQTSSSSETDLSSLLTEPTATSSTGTWTCSTGTFHVDTWANVLTVSGMTTPFMEYWIASNSGKLADATITTALTDMIPGSYTFSALVRLVDETTASNTSISGASMYANSTSVEVNTGTYASENNLSGVYGTYSVTGTVGSDCALKVGFTVASANFNWLAFKSVKLVRTSVDQTNLKTAIEAKIKTAKTYSDDIQSKSGLETAINSFSTATDDDALIAVFEALNTGLTKAAVMSTGTATSYLVNPDFSDATSVAHQATPKGWTVREEPNGNYWHEKDQAGNMEVWSAVASQQNFDLYQTVKDLPAGVYRITADMFNTQNGETDAYVNGATGLYAESGDKSSFVGVPIDATSRSTYSLLITVGDEGTLTLGVKNAYTMKARWFTADNFTLTYVGSDYSTISDEEAAVTNMTAFTKVALKELSGANVKSAATATSAIEQFNSSKTMENYEAVQKAMKAVYSDIDLYYKSGTVTFNDWAVEDNTYYLTYTTTTAVDLDQCYFTAYSVSVDDTKVTKTRLTGIVPASTPLLLTDTKASTTYRALMSTSKSTTTVTTALKSSDGSVTGDGSTIYALGKGENSNVLGWYLLNSSTTMESGKCYLKVENAKGAKFLGFADDDATGINAISSSTKNAARYNLSGQRVGNDYKGIVIENGKKYLVK